MDIDLDTDLDVDTGHDIYEKKNEITDTARIQKNIYINISYIFLLLT